MRIAFVADPHIGNHRRFGGPVQAGINTRCRMALDALKEAVARAVKAKCSYFIVLGDLFDTSRPEPQIIAAVQTILEPIPTVLLLGNHEQISTSSGDHALGPLDPVATIIEKPDCLADPGVEVWMVPFQPGNARDWLPRALAEVQGGRPDDAPLPATRVLCLHLGLSDSQTAPWLKGALDSIAVETLQELCDDYGISFAFAGNWHERKRIDFGQKSLLQVGALTPTGFDNPGEEGYGGLAILDTTKGTLKEVAVPGPRFIKVPWKKLPRHKFGDGPRFVQITCDPSEFKEAQQHLDAEVAAGRVAGGEVVADEVEAAAAAKTAAVVAKSALTLDEAVAGYVAEMPLAEGIDREAVAARVRGYLGRAGR